MLNLLRRWLREPGGATAIEYGLIAALIAVVLIAAATNVQKSTSGKYNLVINAVK
jgi:pilus assembly protein Flp/PilA